MFSTRLWTALALCLFLAGCAGSVERVTDFTDRSVVFGWLDIGDVDANRLHQLDLYQMRPISDTPYWSPKFVKFEGGYLFYAFSFPSGTYKLYEIAGQRCITILCGNSTFTYTFGKQGSTAAVEVGDPGVYYLGSVKLEDVKTGLFEAGKFDVQPAVGGPTERQMLEAMLPDAVSMDALVEQRIRTRIARLP